MAAHDSYSGRICYNGTELKGIRTKSLYDLVSLVQQNLFVINASIRDNITMFRRFPREDVERAIARSLLRKAPVLLVDEATAALDAETVWQVSNSILDLENLTRIVVTHSLEECLLKRYDRILTLY